MKKSLKKDIKSKKELKFDKKIQCLKKCLNDNIKPGNKEPQQYSK